MAARKSILDIETITNKLSKAGVEDTTSVIKEIEIQVNKTIKQKIKEAQPYVNEDYEDGEEFLKIYPEYDLNNLPC